MEAIMKACQDELACIKWCCKVGLTASSMMCPICANALCHTQRIEGCWEIKLKRHMKVSFIYIFYIIEILS
jgi:hypothetical protein